MRGFFFCVFLLNRMLSTGLVMIKKSRKAGNIDEIHSSGLLVRAR